MNLLRLKEWWAYRRAAKSRHGIHSPFVYRLADGWLRHRSKGTPFERCTGFLQEEGLAHLILPAEIPKLRRAFEDVAAVLASGTVLIVPDIHQNVEHVLLWQELCADERVNLSIELWQLGLLFYRPDFKERQHFVLRCRA